MTDLQLSLVLVASIWAAVNTLIAGYRAVNRTRDLVLTGVADDGVQLSLDHRWILYRNDWLPLKAGLSLVSLGFAAFIVVLPALSSDPGRLRWICYIAAMLPFASFLGFFVLGLSDRRFMLATLTRAQERDGGNDDSTGLGSGASVLDQVTQTHLP